MLIVLRWAISAPWGSSFFNLLLDFFLEDVRKPTYLKKALLSDVYADSFDDLDDDLHVLENGYHHSIIHQPNQAHINIREVRTTVHALYNLRQIYLLYTVYHHMIPHPTQAHINIREVCGNQQTISCIFLYAI